MNTQDLIKSLLTQQHIHILLTQWWQTLSQQHYALYKLIVLKPSEHIHEPMLLKAPCSLLLPTCAANSYIPILYPA